MKRSRLNLLIGVVLLVGVGLYGYSSTRTQMMVPVLREDGSIGAEPGVKSSLLASVLREVYNRSGVYIRIFSSAESPQIRNVPGEDYISFFCPAGANVPAHSVLGSAPRFYSSEPYWAWGEYIGNEGTRLAGGDLPSVVFPQSKFLGNVAAQEGGTFPFIGSKTNFTAVGGEKLYVASGGPVGTAVVDCRDADGDGLSSRYETDVSLTTPTDADTDNDGLGDGEELTGQSRDLDGDSRSQSLVTNPANLDTDGDLVQDGTELGRTTGITGTDLAIFVPDADSLTTTNPTVADTDGGGASDGTEDVNKNGRIDAPCETNPNAAADDTITCGNGTVQTCGPDRVLGNADDEQCDDSNAINTDACVACKNAFCGDGFVRTLVCGEIGQPACEACDDGAQNGQPNKCNATCTGTTAPVCGNAIVEIGEACDDGKTCTGDGNWCEPPATGQQECVLRGAGTCQLNADDGCRNNCTIDPLFVCTGTAIGQRSDCNFAGAQP